MRASTGAPTSTRSISWERSDFEELSPGAVIVGPCVQQQHTRSNFPLRNTNAAIVTIRFFRQQRLERDEFRRGHEQPDVQLR